MAETDENCIFCAILAGRAEASILYRDDAVTAFMDISPVVEGHVDHAEIAVSKGGQG